MIMSFSAVGGNQQKTRAMLLPVADFVAVSKWFMGTCSFIVNL